MSKDIFFKDDGKIQGETILSIVLIVLAVSVLVAIYYLSTNRNQKTDQSAQKNRNRVAGAYDNRESNNKTYINKENALKFNYPEEWNINLLNKQIVLYPESVVEKYNMQFLLFKGLSDNINEAQLSAVKINVKPNTETWKIINDIIRQLNINKINSRIISVKDINKDIVTFEVMYQGKNGDYRSKEKLFLFPNLGSKRMGYIISARVSNTEWRKYKTEIDNIIDSISFGN